MRTHFGGFDYATPEPPPASGSGGGGTACPPVAPVEPLSIPTYTYEEMQYAMQDCYERVRDGNDPRGIWLDTLKAHAIATLQDAVYLRSALSGARVPEGGPTQLCPAVDTLDAQAVAALMVEVDSSKYDSPRSRYYAIIRATLAAARKTPCPT